MLKQLLNKGNVPLLFKGDFRSSFIINKRNAGTIAYKDVNTQFGFVLNSLGIRMKNNSEPTFKSAVERFFRTSQNHLKAEFRENEITTFPEANKYLQIYMKWYNKQYSIKPMKTENQFLKKTWNNK